MVNVSAAVANVLGEVKIALDNPYVDPLTYRVNCPCMICGSNVSATIWYVQNVGADTVRCWAHSGEPLPIIDHAPSLVDPINVHVAECVASTENPPVGCQWHEVKCELCGIWLPEIDEPATWHVFQDHGTLRDVIAHDRCWDRCVVRREPIFVTEASDAAMQATMYGGDVVHYPRESAQRPDRFVTAAGVQYVIDRGGWMRPVRIVDESRTVAAVGWVSYLNGSIYNQAALLVADWECRNLVEAV